MKLARIFMAMLFCLFTTTLSQADEYSIIVVPVCSVSSTPSVKIGNVNIEELLAQKFITKAESLGTANAPTISELRISIKNNPNIVLSKDDYISNAKMLSEAYGVPVILLLSSGTKMQDSVEQKTFWQKLNMPVITQQEPTTKLVTTLTLVNAKSNEVIWSDIYYHKIESNIYSLNDKEKLSMINSYYDELVPRILGNMRSTKETHAIMLKPDQKPVEVEGAEKTALKSDIKPIRITSARSSSKISARDLKLINEIIEKTGPTTGGKKSNIQAQNIQSETKIVAKEPEKKEVVKVQNPKPVKVVKTEKKEIKFVDKKPEKKIVKNTEPTKKNIKLKEPKVKTSEKSAFVVWKEGVRAKYNDFQNERKENKIKQAELKKEKEQQKINNKKVVISRQKVKVKEDKKERKTVINFDKIKLSQKKVQSESEKKAEEVKQTKPKITETIKEKTAQIKTSMNEKIENSKKQKAEKKAEKKIEKKVAEVKQPQPKKANVIKEKTVQIKNSISEKIENSKKQKAEKAANKPQKERMSIKEIVKTKYIDIKDKYAAAKEDKRAKTSEKEIVQYSNIVLPEEVPASNMYIQTKLRNSARNYVPRYDSSINDI